MGSCHRAARCFGVLPGRCACGGTCCRLDDDVDNGDDDDDDNTDVEVMVAESGSVPVVQVSSDEEPLNLLPPPEERCL